MYNTTETITMKTKNTINQYNFQIDLCSSKHILFGYLRQLFKMQTKQWHILLFYSILQPRFWQQITHTLSISACGNTPEACNLSA